MSRLWRTQNQDLQPPFPLRSACLIKSKKGAHIKCSLGALAEILGFATDRLVTDRFVQIGLFHWGAHFHISVGTAASRFLSPWLVGCLWSTVEQHDL